MKYFFDTEFLEDGKTIDLISIGIVSESGETYYACASDADWDRIKRHEWLSQNVLPHLPVDQSHWRPKAQIAKEIAQFVGEFPEFWADYSAYDWVVLCQLYGTMFDLPETWPMYCRDVQLLKEIAGIKEFPVLNDKEHDALADAMEVKARFDICIKHLARMCQ